MIAGNDGGNRDLPYDQRGVGFSRRVGDGIDIGAFELQDTTTEVPSTIVVSNLEDENDGDFGEADLALREAIAIAESGDIITFASDLSGGTISLSLGELLIDKNLTIQGLGAEQLTIDGGGASRVFNLDDGSAETSIDVTLDGLAITSGDVSLDFGVDSQGGGILSRENLELTNSLVSGNAAGLAGGGIYSSGSRLSISNSTIDNNSALRPVAVGTTKGGGIATVGSTVEISDSTISNNETSLGGGGLDAQDSEVVIVDSNIVDNFGLNGGGIASVNSTVDLKTTNVSNNRTGSFGGSGAISSDADSVLIVESSVIDSNSGIDPFNPNPPRGGQAFASGIGARGTTTISNSTISNSIVERIDSPPLEDSNISTDSEVGYGIRNTGELEISNSTFSGNTDAGINNDGGSVNITNTTIADSVIGINSTEPNITSSIVVDDSQDLEVAIDANSNLVGNSDSLGLGQLQNNGGATPTIALQEDSPAIDAGINPNSIANDQRGDGFNRTVGNGTDIGAFEVQDSNETPTEPEQPPQPETPIEPEDTVPDTINGTHGNDHLSGTAQREVIQGFAGHDTLDGNGGADTVFGGVGDDLLDDSSGNNKISGEHGRDTLFGGEGHDTLIGGADNDLLVGAAGSDLLQGSDGNDVINGESGDDFINGDAGDDLLTGGTGRDTLLGGEGHDVFVLESLDVHDVIVDFELGSDRLQLSDELSLGQLTIVDNESNTGALIQDSANNNSVIAAVENVQAADLTIHVFC